MASRHSNVTNISAKEQCHTMSNAWSEVNISGTLLVWPHHVALFHGASCSSRLWQAFVFGLQWSYDCTEHSYRRGPFVITGGPLNMCLVVCIHRVYTWCIRHVYNICSAAHKRQRSQNWRPPTTMMTTRTFQAKHLFSTIPTRALQHIGICNVCTQFNLAITNPSREQKPFVVG